MEAQINEKPQCTCKVSVKTTRFDPKCYYHGKDGTMVALVPIKRVVGPYGYQA